MDTNNYESKRQAAAEKRADLDKLRAEVKNDLVAGVPEDQLEEKFTTLERLDAEWKNLDADLEKAERRERILAEESFNGPASGTIIDAKTLGLADTFTKAAFNRPGGIKATLTVNGSRWLGVDPLRKEDGRARRLPLKDRNPIPPQGDFMARETIPRGRG